MGKGFWAYPSPTSSLQSIIANGRCGSQCTFDVPLFENRPLRRGMRPNPRVTVGLKLETYGRSRRALRS